MKLNAEPVHEEPEEEYSSFVISVPAFGVEVRQVGAHVVLFVHGKEESRWDVRPAVDAIKAQAYKFAWKAVSSAFRKS